MLQAFNLDGHAGGDRSAEVRGPPTLSRELTCWVHGDIQDGLEQLHVFNVVNVNGLLQAHQQPLQSHRLINLPDRCLGQGLTEWKALPFPVSPNWILSLEDEGCGRSA